MRVSFQNDNRSTGKFNIAFNSRFHSLQLNLAPLLNHIEEIMTQGFTLGQKIFKFLHYSSSQMKAHS